MRKFIILITGLIAIGAGTSYAQSYTGYLYNNYEGVAGIIANPAGIGGSVYKLDVNILSVSGSMGTNAYKVKASDLFKFDFSGWREGNQYKKINSGGGRDVWANVDILGPSVMVAINPKHSVGLTTRLRFLANERNMSNDVFQLFGSDKSYAVFGQPFRQDNLKVDAHAFADIGLTYGGVLLDNNGHRLKAGISAKWILGLGAGSLYADNVNVNLLDRNNITTLTGNAGFAYSTGIDRLVNGNLNGSFYDYIDAKSFGIDLGFVYEWRNAAASVQEQEENAGEWFTPTGYKLRISASVTDLGPKLKYNVSSNSGVYSMNFVGAPTSILNLNNRSLDEYICSLTAAGYLNMATASELKSSLPTLFRANIDWQAWKRFYVNLDGAVNLVGKNTVGARYISGVALTPRYESRWFSVYSPVSYSKQEEFGWGIGFNVGVFYVGSGSVLSSFIKSDTKSADIHMGMHVPIGRRVRKGKVKPVVQEPVYMPEPEPIPEPVPEPVIPQVDTVIQYVYIEPEPVPEEPKVDEVIVNEVQLLAHSIYFVTGSDWLLIESHQPLNRIAELLMANPTIYATIEGHADSVGSDKANEVLARQRAARVASYLVERGIEKDRLVFVSYGSQQPFASNVTDAGKARNRRVEIRLHY